MKALVQKRVFVTKYALTEGVFEMNAEIRGDKYAIACGIWIAREDWHETKDSAMRRVQQLIAAKRKSMAKTEAKLAQIEQAVNSGSLAIESR